MKGKTAAVASKSKAGANGSRQAPMELRLYVAGQTPRSVKSIENLKRLCEEHLKGRYELEVIDIYQQPGMASENQIIAAPTLIKKLPLPLRRLVGDFSNADRVVVGLDLKIA